MAYYDALVSKWATLTGNTASKLTQINALMIPGPAVPTLVPTYRIYNCLDPAEFVALTAAQQQRLRDILGMGMVDVSTGTNVRAVILAIFGAGTATRTALTAMVAEYESPQILWWSATVAQGGGGLSSPVNSADLAAAGGLT